MKPNLSERDHERVRTRIADAEKTTGGEIVTYVVRKSDSYEVVTWRGAALAALLFLSATLMIYLFYDGWALSWLYTGAGIAAGILTSGLLGVLLVQKVRPVFLAVAGSGLVAMRARARAERAFIDEGVFRTTNQTGILIFISLWEHRIEILPDTGLIGSTEPADWQRVVDAARAELRRGDLTEALVASIDVCGSILRRVLPANEVRADANELDDSVRMGE